MFKYLFTPEKLLPEGVGFDLYCPAHIIWLIALAAMCAVMVVAYKRMDKKGRSKFAKTIGALLLILEVLEDGYLIASGGWMWEYLPLHPCSFTMFLIAIWAFAPNKFCGQVLYGFGIVGAACALIFCNWTNQPLMHFQTIHSFVFHGLLIGFILMAVIGGDIRPEPKGYWYTCIFIAVAALFTGVVNHIVPGVNFFFTNEGSEGSPLEIFIKLFGTPWWLFAYGALAAVIIGLEFLPTLIIEKKRKKTVKA